ncbi:MAG TPA: hypothetical protein VEI28_03720, partial [Thermodesulfovibrionales bacterium]|nr:hypothetical protein [Thermodesulfovibrionales bacterium]
RGQKHRGDRLSLYPHIQGRLTPRYAFLIIASAISVIGTALSATPFFMAIFGIPNMTEESLS